MPTMKIKKLDVSAVTPTKGSEYAAGFDLYSIEVLTLPPQERVVVRTGISIQLPINHYGRIAPRSGLAVNSGIDVLAGVVDEDYTGELKVVLYNTSKDTPFSIWNGMKIAQLIVEPYTSPVLELVEDLNETKRGEQGFGSTGI